jgi:hypothetical protein
LFDCGAPFELTNTRHEFAVASFQKQLVEPHDIGHQDDAHRGEKAATRRSTPGSYLVLATQLLLASLGCSIETIF